MEGEKTVELKPLEIEPILDNVLEYLFCQEELSDYSKDQNDEENDFIEGSDLYDKEAEEHFPYPFFVDFTKSNSKEETDGIAYKLKLFSRTEAKQNENDRRMNIQENIKFYKEQNKLFDFWRINLFQKGQLLTNVACLLLYYLQNQEKRILHYRNKPIKFFGTCVIELKQPDKFSLSINGKSLKKIKDDTSHLMKVLLIKREDGESFYIDYTLSTKGDSVRWNQNGFPCNVWEPCTWKPSEIKFKPSNITSPDLVMESFLENKKELDEYFASITEDKLPDELQYLFVNINLYYLRLCEVVMIKHLI